MSTSQQQLSNFLKPFQKQQVLVIGDFAADYYLYGKSTRISREAPVVILRKTGDKIMPGQAGNVAANLKSLGAKVHCCGIIGKDEIGKGLVKSLKDLKVSTSGIFQSSSHKTISKMRIYGGGHHAARQQIVRIDDDELETKISAADQKKILSYIQEKSGNLNAIIVSDYGYGLLNAQLWDKVLGIAKKRKIPVILDSRFDLHQYQGATVITPNESEAYAFAGIDLDQDISIQDLGKKLLNKMQCEGVILTRGNEGMAIFEKRKPMREIEIHGSDDIVDVTGAGDTVAATVSLALASGASIYQAAEIANISGGLVVMKPGTASVSLEELKNEVGINR